MNLSSRAVLDSYALLSLLKNEKGAKRVQAYLEAAQKKRLSLFLNMMNAGEVFYITSRREGEQKAFETWGIIKHLPLQIVQNDEVLVLQAASLKGRIAFSYADAFAAATAQLKSATLITGDLEFKALSKEIEIDWI